MKPFVWILFILLQAGLQAAAQSTETVRVAAGDDITAAISATGLYRFPAFTSGIVLLKNGQQGKEMLNYNILSEQAVYINEKGDTLAIGIPDQVKKITISGTDFYYDKKECLEEIANAGGTSLLIKRIINITYQKKGAFGTTSTGGGGIDTYSELPASNSAYHLTVDEDAVVQKRILYFLRTAEGRQLPANKANFLTVFAKNKENLNHYLDANRINFTRQQDLVQLLGIAAAGN